MNLPENVRHNRITPIVSLHKFLKDLIEAIENANISSFANDANYITNSVNNLVNYYLKSETYTKAETENLVTDKLDTITQAEFDAIFNDW